MLHCVARPTCAHLPTAGQVTIDEGLQNLRIEKDALEHYLESLQIQTVELETVRHAVLPTALVSAPASASAPL
jgi:hypothetical protein